jgi:hypothetical protein
MPGITVLHGRLERFVTGDLRRAFVDVTARVRNATKPCFALLVAKRAGRR